MSETTAGLAPDIAVVLQAMAASDAPPIIESTPEEAREGFRVLMVDLRGPEHLVNGVIALRGHGGGRVMKMDLGRR